MEKISALIEKLQELKNSNAGLQSISYYVQLLQAEVLHARNLQREQERSQQEQQRHVAVIMPSAAIAGHAHSAPNGHMANGYHTDIPDTTTSAVIPPVEKPVAPIPTVSSRPAPIPPPPPAPIPVQEPVAARQAAAPAPAEKKPAPATLFDQPENAPASQSRPAETNGIHKELKELNELVAQNIPSLNDRLRQGQHTELADRLGDMPVKDLRHAIGINDKFQFIQELFRGDVDSYERSVKTINEFHSLQEAEYWIERELKIRQGWEENNRTVRQFYLLVRKRFS